MISISRLKEMAAEEMEKEKLKCSFCGNEKIAMINYTKRLNYCYNCIPEYIDFEGFLFKKINKLDKKKQRRNNDRKTDYN